MQIAFCARPIMSPLATLVVVLAGCGSGGPAMTVGPVINYGSFGTTADIDCGDGYALNIRGSNNKLNITGTCATVNVGGADNTIRLQRVDGELSVMGLNNTVFYKEGDPRVEDAGSGNRIDKG